MKNKKTIIASIIFGVLLLAGSVTLGYWISGSNKTIKGDDTENNNTVNIGEAEDGSPITTDLSAESTIEWTDKLYPKPVAKVNQKWEVEKSVFINWDGSGATGVEGDLTITTVSLMIGGVDYRNNDMFEIVYSKSNGNAVYDKITAGTEIEIQVKIVFKNEPKNKAEYNAVAGKTMTLKTKYSVADITLP